MQIMRSPISEAVLKWGKVTACNTIPSRVSLKVLGTDLSVRETWMSLRPACNESARSLEEWQCAGQRQQALLQFLAWFSRRRNRSFWLMVLTFVQSSLNSVRRGKEVRTTAGKTLLGSGAQGSTPWRTEPGVTRVNMGLYSPPHPFLLGWKLEFAAQCNRNCR